MRILAIDSSATAASAALLDDDRLLGEFYINTRLTHSQTLMPMIENLLQCTRTELKDVDLYAVSAGPGSFTGIRIGVASIKGLAMAQNKPCAGVSTLEAMAQNLGHMTGTICAVMDARCGQVYNAIFTAHGNSIERITPDRALSIEDLAEDCKNYTNPIILVGDGAKLCYNNERFKSLNAVLPPEHLLYQRAWGVAKSALKVSEQGGAVTPAALMPVYLRLPQAERELKKRNKGEIK
ncbi:tRNA (adenosine(37)-N6)-threonylcarbamoyltransferase complex dimerization subunit type 1 TsaB [Caproiciproducens faecalis]|uniref:tRNA (Adenosine(37)-N6)-threonylcarbamoyltransferase complex dimerization subunit type 1 TsaB n=1 Tax=Caproiciproducens faecalis TaxID=2820301 RepID=A0ABS7DQG3_9FIRM|nr:tRNA (adenosine(37)-N6)-threonylcarbamoyltransferase complex dimerization subunit type 1 TsaB [Caproiciproducens faecalis]MBW7573535.1 tRNA (adenosine(37)-N6)-threonylcarbamoyltransferase complex dimerization subunit type 1 TsaB [Caproiciproducens faecalis]